MAALSVVDVKTKSELLRQSEENKNLFVIYPRDHDKITMCALHAWSIMKVGKYILIIVPNPNLIIAMMYQLQQTVQPYPSHTLHFYPQSNRIVCDFNGKGCSDIIISSDLILISIVDRMPRCYIPTDIIFTNSEMITPYRLETYLLPIVYHRNFDKLIMYYADSSDLRIPYARALILADFQFVSCAPHNKFFKHNFPRHKLFDKHRIAGCKIYRYLM